MSSPDPSGPGSTRPREDPSRCPWSGRGPGLLSMLCYVGPAQPGELRGKSFRPALVMPVAARIRSADTAFVALYGHDHRRVRARYRPRVGSPGSQACRRRGEETRQLDLEIGLITGIRGREVGRGALRHPSASHDRAACCRWGRGRPRITGTVPPGAVRPIRNRTGESQRRGERRSRGPVFDRRRVRNGRSHDANPCPGPVAPARCRESPKMAEALRPVLEILSVTPLYSSGRPIHGIRGGSSSSPGGLQRLPPPRDGGSHQGGPWCGRCAVHPPRRTRRRWCGAGPGAVGGRPVAWKALSGGVSGVSSADRGDPPRLLLLRRLHPASGSSQSTSSHAARPGQVAIRAVGSGHCARGRPDAPSCADRGTEAVRTGRPGDGGSGPPPASPTPPRRRGPSGRTGPAR
ncbi:hypothetical protein FBY22_4835 [Streptomyces sp. SLBN-31]|nr:hypothetical protein FBY22_4835 [Streptomyces sp. SLBN-31]